MGPESKNPAEFRNSVTDFLDATDQANQLSFDILERLIGVEAITEGIEAQKPVTSDSEMLDSFFKQLDPKETRYAHALYSVHEQAGNELPKVKGFKLRHLSLGEIWLDKSDYSRAVSFAATLSAKVRDGLLDRDLDVRMDGQHIDIDTPEPTDEELVAYVKDLIGHFGHIIAYDDEHPGYIRQLYDLEGESEN